MKAALVYTGAAPELIEKAAPKPTLSSSLHEALQAKGLMA